MADHGGQAGCYIKQLPDAVQELAARNAKSVFEPNVPYLMGQPLTATALAPGGPSPASLAVYNQKYWGAKPLILTVSFLESPANELRVKILEHMNAWNCSIKFEQAQAGKAGTVRISLAGQGYWSYLGTDILSIPRNRPTMNLQGFNINTPDSEFRRVVRHETGHTLGFPHEQLRKEIINRIDRQKAYAWFKATYNWTKEMVDSNVLTPINDNDLTATAITDQDSIMCYHLPASIMKDGKEVHGGPDINARDAKFCHAIYPPPFTGYRTVADLNFEEPNVQEEELSGQEGNGGTALPATCAFSHIRINLHEGTLDLSH